KVINIARLLQSLDDDRDPSNGIVIPDATNPVALNFDQEPADFEAQVSQLLGLTLVNQASAMAHLQQELDALAGNSGAALGEPAVVPAGFVGKHSFKYQQVVAGAGIADGSVDEFEVTADNQLKLPNGTILGNPVHVNGN